MRTTHNLLVVSLLLLLAGLAGPALGQGAPPEVPKNRHTDFLAWEEGEWTADIKLVDPSGGPALEFQGRQEDRLGGCGLWLITDLRMVATTTGEEPPPYHGHGVLGYDPARDKLVGLWVDSNTNWLASAEGEVDPEGKRLVLDIQGRDPANGEPMVQRFVTTRLGKNRRQLDVFIPAPDGSEFAVATIEYTRSK